MYHSETVLDSLEELLKTSSHFLSYLSFYTFWNRWHKHIEALFFLHSLTHSAFYVKFAAAISNVLDLKMHRLNRFSITVANTLWPGGHLGFCIKTVAVTSLPIFSDHPFIEAGAKPCMGAHGAVSSITGEFPCRQRC